MDKGGIFYEAVTRYLNDRDNDLDEHRSREDILEGLIHVYALRSDGTL